MIAPITKEYFYKNIEGTTEWKKIYNFELPHLKHDSRASVIYCEKPGEGFFAYLPAFNLLAIPSQFSDMEIKYDEPIDMTDWFWKLTGVGHNKEYTVNLFHRSTDTYSLEMSDQDFCYIKGKIPDKVEINLFNERIGYSENIEMRYEEYPWSKEVFVAYPEKIDLPFNGKKLIDKDIEIMNVILWSRKKH